MEFREINEEERNFIAKLDKKTPEEGLKLIVEKVLKDKEDFIVKIGDKEENYKSGDKRLLDLDSLIDKLNQISRGVVRATEASLNR